MRRCVFCRSSGAQRCTTTCSSICSHCRQLVYRVKRRMDRRRERGEPVDDFLPTWRARVDQERRVDRLRAAAERIGIVNQYDSRRRISDWPDEPRVPVSSLWEAVR